jgi:ElaA protein
VEKNSRGQGIFDAMLKKSLDQIRLTWPGENIRISAQLYLMAFYQSYGFEPVSESYLEDGILHIDMVKNSR